MQIYHKLYMLCPNIEIEVVNYDIVFDPDPVHSFTEKFERLIAEKQPDVLLLDSRLYEKMAGNGELLPLDPMIKKDNFDMIGMFPAVIDFLRQKGDQKLYGLAPNFSSAVLYYNIDLFEQYEVPTPQNQMSWPDVLDLARRFPMEGDKGERIYGLEIVEGIYGFYHLFLELGRTEGLAISSDGRQLSIDTERWRTIFQTAVDAYRTGTIKSDHWTEREDSILFEWDLFVKGQAAMQLNYPYKLDQLEDAKEMIADYKPFRLGIVTVPVDPANPDQTTQAEKDAMTLDEEG